MQNELRTTELFYKLCSLTTNMKDTAKNWFLEEINVGREERFVLPKLLVIELLLTIKRIKFFSKKKKNVFNFAQH